MSDQPPAGNSPLEELAQRIWGAAHTQMIYVAAKLGLADHFKEGPRKIADLAEVTHTHPEALYRLMRGLAGIGIFQETDQRCFEMTPTAAFLQSGFPGAMRTFAIQAGEAWYWRPWGDLLKSVQTGEPVFESIFGHGYFQHFQKNPEAAEVFDQTMSERTKIIASAMVMCYDFTDLETIVDVGGGRGMLLATILQANPDLRGVLHDLPAVVTGADAVLEEMDVADRCETEPGNFFEEVPQGADAYLLASVLHDWNDERALAILANCHRAMPHHGRVLIVEYVIPPGNEPFYGKIMDLDMLVLLGGKERSEQEFESLLDRAGFMLTDVIPTRSPFTIVEAIPK